jgi:AcrR family transcriptional regulator
MTGLAKTPATRIFEELFQRDVKMPKIDRRTERTRAALMRAFIDTLLAEGYEAITVERVAERANVGRSTFYMHYTGKEEILRQSMKNPSSLLAAMIGNVVAPEHVKHQLEHFHAQRRLNHVFFEGAVRAIWISCLAGLIEPRLATLVRHVRARPILPLPLIATQIAEAQLALIANWLVARPSLKAEIIGEALTVSTQGLLAALLRCRPDIPLLIPGEKLRFREV